MEQDIINVVQTLRYELHNLAERSGEEKRTKMHLMKFLSKNTSLRIVDEGQWFYALHEEEGAGETVAFRADMDALPFGSSASHLCGHDGHSAVLAGLGLSLEHKRLGRNILMIFQHSEENGIGGKICCHVLSKYHVSRIYAFHNIPGWDEGTILLRRGVFACTSLGMTISFSGLSSHAAYPEAGHNPGFAAARLISHLPQLTNQDRYKGLTMATLVGTKIGKKAFGTAAGNGEVWLTLRAWYEDDLNLLILNIKKISCIEAVRDEVAVSYGFCDQFPATVNDNFALERLEAVCHEVGLNCIEVAEPFRWSEDFSYYGSYARAVMVGIGTGLDWPQLHTEDYVFNDRIIPVSLKLFYTLAEIG